MVTWSILAGLALGFLVLGVYYGEKQALAVARQRLLEDDYEGAAKVFESLQWSLWNSGEAQTGFAVSSVLKGEPPGTSLPDDSSMAAGRLPCRLLLFRALMDRRYEACLSLARLLGHAEKWGPLFEKVALLELGKQLPDDLSMNHFGNTWLGQRLEMTRERLKSDPKLLVYDRRGAPLGWLDKGGDFQPFSNIDQNLLPPQVEKQLNLVEDHQGCRLGLDWDLSRVAAQALEGYRGSIVIVAIESGDILTAVSDPDTLERDGWAAFTQRREPASIMKLLTLTASLRAGLKVDTEVSQMSCLGAERYGRGILYCPYRAGPLKGLNYAMAISCNIAFADLGVLVGRQGILDELKRYAFDHPPGEGVAYGEILEKLGDKLQLANLSIGLDATSITPVHAALVAAVYGNNGIMPEPRLLSSSDGWLGLSPVKLPGKEGRRVIDKGWIPLIISSMRAVTEQGTAYGITSPDFPLAMKTGTGRNRNMSFHTNYIGIGPMPHPRISFCIRITDQATSGRVRRATLRVARRLFDELSRKTYLLP